MLDDNRRGTSILNLESGVHVFVMKFTSLLLKTIGTNPSSSILDNPTHSFIISGGREVWHAAIIEQK